VTAATIVTRRDVTKGSRKAVNHHSYESQPYASTAAAAFAAATISNMPAP
jgi:hypothetical protein